MSNDVVINKDVIPLPIKVILVSLNVAIAALAFLHGFNLETVQAFIQQIVKACIFIPTFFVIIGLLFKFSDKEFKLSNSYYLGLFMSLVLSARAITTI